MNLLDLLKKRYSCRAFTPQKVEKEKLDKILEAGRVAPTACNKQPQRLIVIREKDAMEKVNSCAKLYAAPLVIVVCTDTQEVWTRAYDQHKTTDIDASIITDHMMLQAAELGLGSLWVCHFNPERLRKEFALPDHLEPVNILAIGYPDGEGQSSERHSNTRKPLTNTVFYEHL